VAGGLKLTHHLSSRPPSRIHTTELIACFPPSIPRDREPLVQESVFLSWWPHRESCMTHRRVPLNRGSFLIVASLALRFFFFPPSSRPCQKYNGPVEPSWRGHGRAIFDVLFMAGWRKTLNNGPGSAGRAARATRRGLGVVMNPRRFHLSVDEVPSSLLCFFNLSLCCVPILFCLLPVLIQGRHTRF
jgi:hypothetical protein